MGKAGKRATYGTKLKNQSNSISELYTLAGIKNAPLSSTMSFGVAGGSSTPPEINTQERLMTSGDSMVGAIAYYPKITVIDGSGAIDVIPSDELGDLTDDYTTYLIVTPVGVADDLVTISNPSNAGQLLHLEANSTGTITLKHNTGNIFIPSEADFTIEAGGFATLIYDVVIHTDKWVLVSTSGGGWSGNATSDLDMNTFDIIDVDRLQFTSDSGAGRDNAKVEIYANSNTPEDAVFNHPASSKIRFTEDGQQYLTFGESASGIGIILPPTDSTSSAGLVIGDATHRPYAIWSRTMYVEGGGAGVDGTLIGLNFANNAGVNCGGSGYAFTSIWNGLEDLGRTGNYWNDLYTKEINLKEKLTIADSSADPVSNGQFTRNGNDVKVYTDGGVKNLTDIGTGGASGANTELSNLTSSVAVNQNLVPTSDVSSSLGSASKRWNQIRGLSAVFGSLSMSGDIDMNNNEITDCGELDVTQINARGVATAIAIGDDLDLDALGKFIRFDNTTTGAVSGSASTVNGGGGMSCEAFLKIKIGSAVKYIPYFS